MTEEQSFLRCICERPDDDTARLVFADWLDDHADDKTLYTIGHHTPDTSRRERARFIRTQIEQANNPPGHYLTKNCRCGSCKTFRALNKTLKQWGRRWMGEVTYRNAYQVRWYKGFVETIEVPDTQNIDTWPLMMHEQPVTKMIYVGMWWHTVTAKVPTVAIDKRLFGNDECWEYGVRRWNVRTTDVSPMSEFVVEFADCDYMRKVLSDVWVNWARRKAGFPELTCEPSVKV